MYDEDMVEELLDTFYEDNVDWLADTLQREFPGIDVERFEATEWRFGLSCTLPAQTSFTRAQFETRAYELRDKIFFENGVLVALTISRQGGGE